MNIDELINKILEGYEGSLELEISSWEEISKDKLDQLKSLWKKNIIRVNFNNKITLTFDSDFNNTFYELKMVLDCLRGAYTTNNSEQKEVKLSDDAMSAVKTNQTVLGMIIEGEANRLNEYIKMNYASVFSESGEAATRIKIYNFLIKTLVRRADGKQKEQYKEVLNCLEVWGLPYQEPARLVKLENGKMECCDDVFPTSVVWTQDLRLYYGAKVGSSKTPCIIPDSVQPSGLTLHETQALEEAIFHRTRAGNKGIYYSYEDGKIITTEKAREKFNKSKIVECLKDVSDYPDSRELSATNYIVANIGFVIKIKDPKPGEPFAKFVSFPINDDEYSLITQAQLQLEAKDPHTELNLYAYLKSDNFKKWLISQIKNYLKEFGHLHGERPKFFATVLDFHSTNTVCDRCQEVTFSEQSPTVAGNVNSVIKNCLLDAGCSLPSHGLLRMVTRVSAAQGDFYASARNDADGYFYDHAYESYNKDLRQLVTQSGIKSASAGENKTITAVTGIGSYHSSALKMNNFILHQVRTSLRDVVAAVDKTIETITLPHTTFFKNRAETSECKRAELKLPSSVLTKETSSRGVKRKLETEGSGEAKVGNQTQAQARVQAQTQAQTVAPVEEPPTKRPRLN